MKNNDSYIPEKLPLESKVTLDEGLVKEYYRSLTIKYNLPIAIVFFLAGSITTGLYIFSDQKLWYVGLGLFVVTFFVCYVLLFMNNRKVKQAINNPPRVKDFYFHFYDERVEIVNGKDELSLSYKSIKLKKIRKVYRISYVDQKISSKIYIFSENAFGKENMAYIMMKYKEVYRRKD